MPDPPPLSTLAEQYTNSTATHLRAKLRTLPLHCDAWRHVRGDGNCFYRAFALGWLEWLVSSTDLDGLRHCHYSPPSKI